METKTKKIAGVVGSSLMVASMGLGATTAFADTTQTAVPEMDAVQADAMQASVGARQAVSQVLGIFAFTQDAVNSVDEIAQRLAAAPDYLCGHGVDGLEAVDVAAEDWTIEVGGNVHRPYMTTIAELQEDPAAQTVLMGCSCAGNPADGRATVNAEVTGVSVKALIQKAGRTLDANTVVFTSADGYEVALPLSYVVDRYCPIVFDVNGSPIAESVGGANQLWLGSTSARYFARNIVSITVETRDEVPAAPGTDAADDEYANLPNIGVDFGGEIA